MKQPSREAQLAHREKWQRYFKESHERAKALEPSRPKFPAPDASTAERLAYAQWLDKRWPGSGGGHFGFVLAELCALEQAARYVTETYYDAGGDMTGPLGEALDALDLALTALKP